MLVAGRERVEDCRVATKGLSQQYGADPVVLVDALTPLKAPTSRLHAEAVHETAGADDIEGLTLVHDPLLHKYLGLSDSSYRGDLDQGVMQRIGDFRALRVCEAARHRELGGGAFEPRGLFRSR